MVVKAIGQKKHKPLLERLKQLGIKDVKGYIEVDPATNRTSYAKIFAGGDCVRSHGEASTVMGVQDGKIAAKGIYAQLIGALPDEGKKAGCASAHSCSHSH
jgi:glutamate synthase (NADPH/NADH) small chain